MTNAGPTNSLVSALLVDLYQVTMTYAQWKAGKHEEMGVFELFFRKNPFQGEFTVFCGLDECLKHVETFSFSSEDVVYLRSVPALAHCDQGFFEYLLGIDASQVTVHALREGTVTFPRIPLLTVEAPIGLGQLLETTLLNLVNYPSLVATNAARMVVRASPIPCIEFGLRRAQGPDGACSASKYSYIGGFMATSNVQAGKLFQIPVAGTHAHSYVQAFTSLEEVQDCTLVHQQTQESQKFLPIVLQHRATLPTLVNSITTTNNNGSSSFTTNDGELASFVAYACAFPNSFLCLVDTYDTLQSGLPNFVAVALALEDFGYQPKGIRLDSGDLCALSNQCAAFFQTIAHATQRPNFRQFTIVASNDINEQVLQDLATRQHSITMFGIGTHLVTCQAQPALGCVYKLVEWQGRPRIKISQDSDKVTIPGRKKIFRIHGPVYSQPILDLLLLAEEDDPVVGSPFLCRDPFEAHGRYSVVPSHVEPLQLPVFPISTAVPQSTLEESREFVQTQLLAMSKHTTSTISNPERYPVMVSQRLFDCLHELWERDCPIQDISKNS